MFGHFEIVSPLGAGGMGEVYRARDTRLNRTVAIKVLPRHFADNPDARERFEREARAIASLNHPHICVLYDIGRQNDVDYLVMEYLEGETLAERLAQKPLPLDLVFRYAVEIADALDKAHKSGITHRDLKPANVMLTKSGAKLLDFGVAKFHEQTPDPVLGVTSLATMEQKPATAVGTILGTVQYMAPEQIEARAVDARTDIFAFGLVVHEMATGKKAFEGPSTASVMAKILESEPPPISSLQPMTPVALDRIVKTCLAKDPDDRWQSAGDLKRELKWLSGVLASPDEAGLNPPMSSAATIASRASHTSRVWLPWTLAGLSAAAAITIGVVHVTARLPVPPPAMQFDVRLPDRVQFTSSTSIVLSPDGHTVAFAAVGADNTPHLWVQNLDGTEARPLVNTDVGGNVPPPFWSIDSKFLVFSGFANVRKVNIATGTVEDLCQKPGPVVGGSWNAQGVIIFGTNSTGLWKTSASGGKAAPLTTLNAAWHEHEHELPQFLPDGKHFLYLRVSDTGDRTGIYVGSLDDPSDRQSETRLLDTGFGATFVPSTDGAGGHLLTFRDGVLKSQHFDPTTLKMQGEPVTVAERVASAYETPQYGATSNLVVFRVAVPLRHFQLTWLDGTGKPAGGVGGAFEDIGHPTLSPDESRVVFSRTSGGNTSGRDLWVLDLARGVSMRLTAGSGDNLFPLWSPDGKDIVFASNRESAHYSLYRKPADGSRPEEALLKMNANIRASSWSTDGLSLVFDAIPEKGNDRLFVMPLRDRAPVPLPTSNFDETVGRISADGRWLAYSSMESGRSEVYVREVVPSSNPLATRGKWVVSKDGGYWPMWRKDGRELWYVSADQTIVMAVSVDVSHTFEAGTPRVMFRLPDDRYRSNNAGWITMANTSDLKRFLLPLPVDDPGIPSFKVLVNWKHE
jgi:serine/threonine protein kinase/Tol biopolymer transport system component